MKVGIIYKSIWYNIGSSPVLEKYFNYKRNGPLSALGIDEAAWAALLAIYPGKRFEIEALFVNIAASSAKKLAADLEDKAFRAYLFESGKSVRAWEVAILRPNYRKDIAFLEKLNDLMEPSIINKLPNGQSDLDDIIAALVHPHTGSNHPFMKNVALHLEDVKYLISNFSEIDGFDKVISALKNKNFYAQDGASFLLTKLKTLNPSDVSRLEGKILDADNLDGICENCLFDIQLTSGKKIEMKSYSESTLNSIAVNSKFRKQFKAYLASIEDIDGMEYVFNRKKFNNLGEIKNKFKELFQHDNYSIYDEVNQVNPSIFSSLGIDDLDDFITKVDGLDPNLYNFISVY
jgi:hypothetical protein